MTSEHHSENGDGTLSIDELHTVLDSDARRQTLHFFDDREQGVATLEELADYLVERENRFEDTERAKVVLHHVALPKLADVGVLDYDPRTNTTRHRGHTRLESLLPDVSVA